MSKKSQDSISQNEMLGDFFHITLGPPIGHHLNEVGG